MTMIQVGVSEKIGTGISLAGQVWGFHFLQPHPSLRFCSALFLRRTPSLFPVITGPMVVSALSCACVPFLVVCGSLQLLGGIIVAFIYGWKLTLVLLSLSPLMVFAGFLQFYFFTKSATQSSKAQSKVCQFCFTFFHFHMVQVEIWVSFLGVCCVPQNTLQVGPWMCGRTLNGGLYPHLLIRTGWNHGTRGDFRDQDGDQFQPAGPRGGQVRP